MHVLENVKGMTLTIAKDARRYAAAVLKNAEGWQDKLKRPTNQPLFSFNAAMSFRYDHHS
jgi:hypothetical protein